MKTKTYTKKSGIVFIVSFLEKNSLKNALSFGQLIAILILKTIKDYENLLFESILILMLCDSNFANLRIGRST